MTIKEAIKHCEEVASGETDQGKCSECAAEHKKLAGWLRELVALRAKQNPDKLDRSRWWCAHCNDMAAKQSMIRHGENYCCNCGCPITEEAWAELERRINGETTD